MKCPTCGLINPEDAQRCDCGYDFGSERVGRPYYRDPRLDEIPNLMRQSLIALICFNLLVAIVVAFYGGLDRLLVVAIWSILLYFLFRAFRRRRRWARSALALLTFPLGLIFFTGPYTAYLNADSLPVGRAEPAQAEAITSREPQKQWTGEAGYCNGLLVSMSRIGIRRIELSTERALPNLDELTASRPDTNRWIKAQEFPYEELDRLTVIRIFAEMAGISPGSRPLSGTLEIVDVVGDDGPTVERSFDMEILTEGEGLGLVIVQRGMKDAEEEPSDAT